MRIHWDRTRPYRKNSSIIRQQSIIIKELIEDLNLTSKLEYQMQPLRMEACSLSALLRQLVADYYNQNLEERYTIDLRIEEAAEKTVIRADKGLLTRAFRNLIGNSIRHNPQGCHIIIEIKAVSDHCMILYQDTGMGISQEVLDAFSGKTTQNATAPHIMGLYLVERILQSHKGTFRLTDTGGRGMKATIWI